MKTIVGSGDVCNKKRRRPGRAAATSPTQTLAPHRSQSRSVRISHGKSSGYSRDRDGSRSGSLHDHGI
ncbi:MAG TPA: hypothetical protein PKM59_11440, partial [Thermodesulfobacteriota bacterium]|nr:hypothetical protein [Thermodesulfobacteriota bacterium]